MIRPPAIYDFLAGKEGDIWMPSDTAYVRSVFQQVEKLAEDLVAKARNEAMIVGRK